jgi:serine/threonine protein phosphatase PrpC
VLYTDGFTDVVGEDADERTELLESTVAGLSPGSAADEVVEQVVSACLPAELSDDVALLVVRLDD